MKVIIQENYEKMSKWAAEYIIKAINKAMSIGKKKEEEAAPTTKKCPHCCEEVNINATKCPHCTGDIPAE